MKYKLDLIKSNLYFIVCNLIFRADASNSLPINILIKILYLIEY